jgi:hypothetical protein
MGFVGILFTWAVRPGFVVASILAIASAAAALAAGGCAQQPVSTKTLEIHQSLVEKDGLLPVKAYDALHVSCAMPRKWVKLPDDQGLIYMHEQWRSPSEHTGVGVAYIHMPLPISAQMLIWFARNEYTRKQDVKDPGGHVIGQWTDALGRVWFEAENAKYHVKGYAMTRGFDSWIVYTGYRVKNKPNAMEINLAARAADSVAPLSGGAPLCGQCMNSTTSAAAPNPIAAFTRTQTAGATTRPSATAFLASAATHAN